MTWEPTLSRTLRVLHSLTDVSEASLGAAAAPPPRRRRQRHGHTDAERTGPWPESRRRPPPGRPCTPGTRGPAAARAFADSRQRTASPGNPRTPNAGGAPRAAAPPPTTRWQVRVTTHVRAPGLNRQHWFRAPLLRSSRALARAPPPRWPRHRARAARAGRGVPRGWRARVDPGVREPRVFQGPSSRDAPFPDTVSEPRPSVTPRKYLTVSANSRAGRRPSPAQPSGPAPRGRGYAAEDGAAGLRVRASDGTEPALAGAGVVLLALQLRRRGGQWAGTRPTQPRGGGSR